MVTIVVHTSIIVTICIYIYVIRDIVKLSLSLLKFRHFTSYLITNPTELFYDLLFSTCECIRIIEADA